jgi:hypothetical protein
MTTDVIEIQNKYDFMSFLISHSLDINGITKLKQKIIGIITLIKPLLNRIFSQENTLNKIIIRTIPIKTPIVFALEFFIIFIHLSLRLKFV